MSGVRTPSSSELAAAAVRESVAAVGMDSIPASVLVRIADALSVPDGGFSINVGNWRDARAGYAVSVFPECEERITGPAVQARIAQYLMVHATLLAAPDVVLGGWHNPADDAVYLDVSVIVPTREKAMAIAQENSQVAVWDFAACRSLPLVDDFLDLPHRAADRLVPPPKECS